MITNEMFPQYSTVLFTDVWDDVDTFKADLAESPFAGCIHYGETVGTAPNQTTYPDNVSLIFYLLYARYGNNPIANRDTNQWKFKIFSVLFQYGPTWEKRLDIQDKLRHLSEDDIIKGSKSIFNHAFNPSTAPSTSSLDELTYINDQSTSNYKKSKMDAYMQLWELLDNDVTEDFIKKFRPCFKTFVSPERPLLYSTEFDDDEIVGDEEE